MRRPTCSARPKAAGDRAKWRSPTCMLSSERRRARRTSSTSGDRARHPHPAARAAADRRLRRRHRPVQRRRGLLLRHQHQPRGLQERAAATATPRSTSRSTASIWSRAPTSSMSPFTSVDGYPYDYHRLLYTFRVKSRTKDVGIYRPTPRVAVFGGHQAVAAVRTAAVRLEDAGSVLSPQRRGSVRAAATRGRQAGRLHQRRVRPAASRARPLPAGRRASLGDALIVGAERRRVGPAQQGRGPADQRRNASARSCSRRSRASTPSWCSTRTRRRRSSRVQPDVLVKGADWAGGSDRRPRYGRGARRPGRPRRGRGGSFHDRDRRADPRGLTGVTVCRESPRRSPASCSAG